MTGSPRQALALACVAAAACPGGCGGDAEPPVREARTRPGTTTTARAPSAQHPALPATIAADAPGAHLAARERVPILMYHVINRPPPGTPDPELWVSREDLAAQVAALQQRGYHGVTLQQVYDAWHNGGLLPSRPIVLSFDDGYHSHFTNALPVLRERGWPGVLNMQVKLLRSDLKPAEVEALLAAGWELSAHTISHADLTTLGPAQLRAEVAGSRHQLRRRFGVAVNFFCYPAGKYDAEVVAAVADAGYLGATTVEPGLAGPEQPPFELRRVRVNGSDGVDGLLESLQAAGAPTS